METMLLLSEKWNDIEKVVIVPLWKRKYQKLYEKVKLDFDDFESLAGLELTKAFQNYDESASNIFTYSTMVLSRKALAEYQSRNRQKRFADSYAESLSQKISENSETTLEDIVEDLTTDESEDIEIEEAISAICKVVTKTRERKIIELASKGYDDEKIAEILHIDVKVVRRTKKRIAERSEIRRLVRKLGYLGGEE